MSDKKGPMGGLFVNKKAAAPTAPAAPGAKPKNVKQRWTMIGVAAVGFIVISSSFFGKKNEPVRTEKKEVGMVSVGPTGVDKKDWMSQSSQQLRNVEADNDKLKAELANLQKVVQKMRDDEEKNKAAPTDKEPKAEPQLPPGVVAPPTRDSNKPSSNANVPPPPPVPPSIPGAQTKVNIPAPVGVPSFPTDGMSSAPLAEAQVFKPESKPQAAAGAADAEGVKASSKYKKNPYNGFLPAGSFAPVVLLNGLDAGTSTTTQANPMPVLMTITDQATLPGSAKYSVKSCFVLGTGYGDMSAERVYVRYSRLSCVDKSDRLVLSADVSGYLVDSDGKIGLRGKVIDRQGAKLGKALLAGFAQGLTGALGQAQSTVTSSALGSTTSIGGADALRASGLSGAQSATQQLAQFYLKEAQAMFPVISIDTGRTGTIVFTDSASLVWSTGDGQYVKETKPE